MLDNKAIIQKNIRNRVILSIKSLDSNLKTQLSLLNCKLKETKSLKSYLLNSKDIIINSNKELNKNINKIKENYLHFLMDYKYSGLKPQKEELNKFLSKNPKIVQKYFG